VAAVDVATAGTAVAMPPLNGVVVMLVVVAYCTFWPGASGQVVAVKPLPALAAVGVHVSVRIGPVVKVLHVVVTKLLPAVGAIGAQAATAVGPVGTRLQVVCVWALPGAGPVAVHVPGATAVGPVVTGLQVVVTKPLIAAAAAALQDATGTLLVVVGAGQVIRTKLFPALGDCSAHEAAG